MNRLFFIIVVTLGVVTYAKRHNKYVARYLAIFDIDKSFQTKKWLMPPLLYVQILALLFILSYSLFAIIAVFATYSGSMTIAEFLRSWFEGLCFMVLILSPTRILPEIPWRPHNNVREGCGTTIKFVWYLQIVFYTWVIMNIYHQFVGIILLKGLRLFLLPQLQI